VGKVRTEVRLIIDDSRTPEFVSNINNDKSTSIAFYPIVSVILVKPYEVDEQGNRSKPVWNSNDALGMNRYHLPIFIRELDGIYQDLKTPEMYRYTGTRLELNEEAAAKIRRVFKVGSFTLELSAVVIVQEDDNRIEGIKMKFNNEQSTVLLTLNDTESLLTNLRGLDIDSIALMMYLNYITKPNKPRSFDASSVKPTVDIAPKATDVEELM